MPSIEAKPRTFQTGFFVCSLNVGFIWVVSSVQPELLENVLVISRVKDVHEVQATHLVVVLLL